MSIVSKFFSTLFAPGPVPFPQRFNGAIQTAAVSIDKWVTGNPTASALAAQTLSDTKQAVSTALSLADTEVGPLLQPTIAGIETALDLFATAVATKVGGPAGGIVEQQVGNPLFNAGLSQAFQVLHGQLDHAELEMKAWAASPSTVGNVTVPGAAVADPQRTV